MRDILLICHMLGLGMGVGGAFCMAALSITSASMAPEDRRVFMDRAGKVQLVSHIGLALVWLSGVAMFATASSMYLAIGGNLFITKVGLAALLLVFVGAIARLEKRARAGEGEKVEPILEVLGKASLLVSIVIVVLAVLAFH